MLGVKDYPAEGRLAKLLKKNLPLQVCESHAGFYIGTLEDGTPYTRESIEYWETGDEAQAALNSGAWTQKRTL